MADLVPDLFDSDLFTPNVVTCSELGCDIPGFGYLHWFHEICTARGITDTLQIVYIRMRLGAYPRARLVLATLYNFGLNTENPLLTIPKLIVNGVYHVNPGGSNKATLIGIMDYFTRHDAVIGGDVPNTVQPQRAFAVAASLKTLPAALYDVVTEKQFSDKSSALYKSLESHAHNALLEAQISPTSGDEIKIDVALSVGDQITLTNEYSNFCITYAPSGRSKPHSHPIAKAPRVCELQQLLTDVKHHHHRSSVIHDADVCDVGGSVLAHFGRGRLNVHVCAPILGPRDSSRFTNTTHFIVRRKYTDQQNEWMVTMQDPDRRKLLYCAKPAQFCDTTARACVFLHSTYDMTPQLIADIMQRKNSMVGAGTFIFDSRMYVNTRGHIADLKCDWDVVKTNDSKIIRFSFVDDHSWSYEHDYDTYLGLMNTNVITTSDGKDTYYVELGTMRLEVQFFSLTKNLITDVPRGLLSRRVPLQQSGMVCVVFYEWDARAPVNTPFFTLKKVVITCPRKLAEDLFAYALRCTDNKFTPIEIFNMACSYTRRVIVNGVAVRTPDENERDHLDTPTLYKLCNAIYLLAYCHKFHNGVVTKELISEIQKLRALQSKSFIGRMWCGAKSVTSKVLNLCKASIINVAFFWAMCPNYFSVDLYDAVRFVEVRDIIQENVNPPDNSCVGAADIDPSSVVYDPRRHVKITESPSPRPLTHTSRESAARITLRIQRTMFAMVLKCCPVCVRKLHQK